ncbi:MAG: hypothetical protein C0606_17490 [Hyphomicrobiales bacterium]|nr:MAG: hypothetical protein C0606_17490 [Hyphomicrobiales bacterium]
MIPDPTFFAVAVPAVFLVGLSKGGFGGSIALLAVPLMALVVPPLKAAGILLPILVAMDIVGLIAYRRTYDTRVLKVMIPSAIVGIGIAWMAAAYITDAHVRLIVGTVGVLFTLDYVRGGGLKRPPAGHNPKKGTVWGIVAGITSFVSHAGGPPYQMYTLPLRLEPVLFAGTATVFFAAVNAVKLVPYFALGQFSTENLGLSLMLLPLAPVAVLSGVWLVRRVPAGPFYRITYAAVFIVSLKLIWDGMQGVV